MKQVLLFFALVGTMAACKKDKTANGPISGAWTWQYSVGGFSGHDTIKPAANNTVVLTFKQNLAYTVTLNNLVVNSGSYQVTAPADLPIILFNNYTNSAGGFFPGPNGVSFHQKDSTLKLMDAGITEPYTHHFTKPGYNQ